MKTLVIYVLHEINDNIPFFIRHGLFEDPNVDFWFVVNDPVLKVEVPSYVHVVNRENVGHDFGGYSAILFGDNDRYKKYDYFLMINSTVRGPFLPMYYPSRDWVSIFTRLITDEIKLGGTTIGCLDNHTHVQSMVLVTDRVGLDIGIQHGIFTRNIVPIDKEQVILQKEIGYSTLILHHGYNIGCLLKGYQGVDFRKVKSCPNLCPFSYNGYCEGNTHPYEIIFEKVPGNWTGNPVRYTGLHDKTITPLK